MTELGYTTTKQEDDLYKALTKGDHDAMKQMRQDAYTADQTPPSLPPPEGWETPAEQFDIDYQNAHAHYQTDHEMPEGDREQATAEQVQEENTAAPDEETGA